MEPTCRLEGKRALMLGRSLKATGTLPAMPTYDRQLALLSSTVNRSGAP